MRSRQGHHYPHFVLLNLSIVKRSLLAFAWFAVMTVGARAEGGEAGLFRPLDVVAVVGGEDMVATADYGYLEYLLVRARPEYQMKFRSIAKEGDTAFEQARDFNYPTPERQLDEMGATVALVQVGQMESLRGSSGVAEFEKELEKLVERLSGGGRRRVILVGPTPVLAGTPAAERFGAVGAYGEAVRRVARRKEVPCLLPGERKPFSANDYRDALHLNERGQFGLAAELAEALAGVKGKGQILNREELRLVKLIQSKNQLWFNYLRPQNWAFLDGDRTVQPASRDHLDPEKRWFPEEMKAWLPLIAGREAEIWALARQLGSK